MHSIFSRPISTANTWSTCIPFQPRMTTNANSTPAINASKQFEYRSTVETPAAPHPESTNLSLTANLHAAQTETQHNQQLVEALAKVTQLQRLPQAKTDVYREDEKDKIKYLLWESEFASPRRFGSSNGSSKPTFALSKHRRKSKQSSRTASIHD